MTARRRMRFIALAAVLVLATCGGDDDTAERQRFDDVVPESADEVASIVVRAGDRSVPVPDDLRARAAPLLAGRVLAAPEPLSSYGLDAPRATLVYTLREGRTRTVRVGGPTFDARGYYVTRDGDTRVYLVTADQLDPLLRLL